MVSSGQVKWFAPQATPSLSAFTVLQSLPEDTPVLVTTADHALLTAEMVDHFCREARTSGCDVLAGVARHELIAEAVPGTRRTVTKLKDGGYCGCNLFAFLTPESRKAADFWRQVEKERKKPLRIIKVMGWMTVIRYLLGQLSLGQALNGLSKRMGLRAGAVQMPFAEAAIDVDKVEDLHLVESILAERQKGAPLNRLLEVKVNGWYSTYNFTIPHQGDMQITFLYSSAVIKVLQSLVGHENKNFAKA